MADCLKCGGKDAAYPFPVLEIQTLHVRDLNGEKRVQALGLRQEYHICAACAREKLARVNSRKNGLKKLLPFAGITLGGLTLTAASWQTGGIARMVGLAAVLGGLLALAATVQEQRARRAVYSAADPEEALALAAWDVLLEAAPKKDGDNDLTYIPIDETTLARKEGDLMVLYDLLPAIARKAYRFLHNIPEEENQS